jgi:hypothetical protein
VKTSSSELLGLEGWLRCEEEVKDLGRRLGSDGWGWVEPGVLDRARREEGGRMGVRTEDRCRGYNGGGERDDKAEGAKLIHWGGSVIESPQPVDHTRMAKHTYYTTLLLPRRLICNGAHTLRTLGRSEIKNNQPAGAGFELLARCCPRATTCFIAYLSPSKSHTTIF